MKERKITPREKEFIELMSQGYTDQQVADKMGVSFSYIRFIFKSCRFKSGADNRVQLVSWAYKNGILQ